MKSRAKEQVEKAKEAPKPLGLKYIQPTFQRVGHFCLIFYCDLISSFEEVLVGNLFQISKKHRATIAADIQH